MDTLAAQLKESKLLEALPMEILRRDLIPHGQLREYPKGTYLISAQERVDHLQIVLSGKVHTLHLFADGSSSVTGSLTAGRVLGLDLVCTRTRIAPYHALAAANTTVFSFPADRILCAGTLPEVQRQALMAQLLSMVANLNMQKEYRLAILSQNGLRSRILTYLTMQANRRRTNTFTAPFNREELASFLCVNRSALSHQLSLMKQEGLIDYSGNTFTLLQWKPQQEVF